MLHMGDFYLVCHWAFTAAYDFPAESDAGARVGANLLVPYRVFALLPVMPISRVSRSNEFDPTVVARFE
jgi:hypothetical protein